MSARRSQKLMSSSENPSNWLKILVTKSRQLTSRCIAKLRNSYIWSLLLERSFSTTTKEWCNLDSLLSLQYLSPSHPCSHSSPTCWKSQSRSSTSLSMVKEIVLSALTALETGCQSWASFLTLPSPWTYQSCFSLASHRSLLALSRILTIFILKTSLFWSDTWVRETPTTGRELTLS